MHTLRHTVKRQANLAARYGQVAIPAASDTDKLIANLADSDGRPLVDYWISPLLTTLEPSGAGIQDRRQGSVQWVAAGDGALSVADGRILLPGTFTLSAGGRAPINPDAFTLIARVAPMSGGVLIGTEGNSTGSTGSVKVGTSGVTTEAGGSTNVADNAGTLIGEDLVITVTFSTARGVTIRRNGIQTYANPARTAPNMGNSLYLFGTGTATTRLIGGAGYLLYSLQDLSHPALAVGLSAIEKTLVDLG